jgi:hypothetical protein
MLVSVAMPFDPPAAMPTGAGRMVRVVDDAGAFAVGDELAGDGDDIAGMERHARREVDVVDDVEPQPVLGDDVERLVQSVRVAADEEMRLVDDRSRDDDIGDPVMRSGRDDAVIGKAGEKGSAIGRFHDVQLFARTRRPV